VVGAIDGLAGLTTLAIAAFADRDTARPEITLPYGLGLLALSAYNFASSASDSGDTRFWTNVVGLNVVVLAGILGGTLWSGDTAPGGPSVRAGPSGIVGTIRF
jgi:hypothetical protein